jgi:hypothetical protein
MTPTRGRSEGQYIDIRESPLHRIAAVPDMQGVFADVEAIPAPQVMAEKPVAEIQPVRGTVLRASQQIRARIRKAPAPTRTKPTIRYRTIRSMSVIMLALAMLICCEHPTGAGPIPQGIHSIMEAGKYQFHFVTPESAEYPFVKQTLSNNIHQAYTDGMAAGFADLGNDRQEFIVANENTGKIAYWATLNLNATPHKTITYHNLAGAGDIATYNILEKSGSLWILQTPESGRIDFARNPGTGAITGVYYTPETQIGRVKGIQNGMIKDLYLQELTGDTQYQTLGITGQAATQAFGRITGTDQYCIANNDTGNVHYQMILDRPNMRMVFLSPSNPIQVVMESAITDEGPDFYFATPGGGTCYVLYQNSDWNQITEAALFDETLP